VAFAFDRSGYVAGGQIGFNHQTGSVVWGIEADISATDINGSQSVISPPCGFCGGPNLSSVNQDMNWFGTLRARLGFAANNWLFYGTGGLAFGHVNISYLNTNAPFGGALTIAASASDVLVGWTIGGGIEYGFGPWSAKVEYLYYDLGSISVTAPNPLAPPGLGVALIPNFKVDGSIIRAGINYRVVPTR
jgi:outer membrane immunogenic protein